MIRIPFFLVTGLCVSLGTCLSVSAEEEVFRSISEDGTIEFSDRGDASSSKKFNISKPVVIPALDEIVDSGNTDEPRDSNSTVPTGLASNATYETLKILTPKHNEGGWIDGDVQVKLALTPGLKAGHEVVIELNGKEITAGTQLNHSLPDIHRGLHTLQVSVRDKTNGSTLSSDTVEFQVHRRSAKSNTRMLHPSLQPTVVVNPSDINEILKNQAVD